MVGFEWVFGDFGGGDVACYGLLWPWSEGLGGCVTEMVCPGLAGVCEGFCGGLWRFWRLWNNVGFCLRSVVDLFW
jgi:hypothetical protein